MDRFPHPLRVELLDRKRWRLLAPFSYLDRDHGRIDIPKGAVTDFASVPRWPLTFALLGQYGHAAAALHDYLYETGRLSRKAADRVFSECTAIIGTRPVESMADVCGSQDWGRRSVP